jgi:hypothetical protein
MPILRTFVETESNHSSHKSVTSFGNFQSRSRIRGQSRAISATFAAPQCMQVCSRSRRRKPLTCLVFPPCCKPKVESTQTEHEIWTNKPLTSSKRKTYATHNCTKHDAISAFSSLEFCPVPPLVLSGPLLLFNAILPPRPTAAFWRQSLPRAKCGSGLLTCCGTD